MSALNTAFHSARRRWGPPLTLVLTTVFLAACATPLAPPPAPVDFPFDAVFAPSPHDSDTGASAMAVDADPMAMSPAMQAYAAEHLRAQVAGPSGVRDRRQVLLEALYQNQLLRLHYDDSITRTAAQAFERRAGNCLSLALMTAAFAKHAGLPVSFQVLDVEETHIRRGGLYLSSGHINVVLQKPRPSVRRASQTEDADLVIDFLPGRDIAGARIQAIDETTLLAMYHNNRAAELLASGRTQAAYWHARAAVLKDPGFVPAHNTLGVVYQKAALMHAAERSYRQALKRHPHNLAALSNLAGVLRLQGRNAEAEPTERLLAALERWAPFQAFEEGRRAMAAGDYQRARQLFDQELVRQPYQPEVHHWAAQAHNLLGNGPLAAHHLARARDHSGSPSDRQRFSAKLQTLRENTH